MADQTRMRSEAALLLAFGLACAYSGAVACRRAPSPAGTPSPTAAPSASASSPAVSDALRSVLAEPRDGFDPSREEREALAKIYPPAGESAIWLDAKGRPSKAARDAVVVLGDAAAEGLNPADYRADVLTASAAGLENGKPSPDAQAQFDASLSLSLARYLRHYHRGRVDPRSIGFLMTLPPDPHDYGASVRVSALDSKVRETIASMAPPLVQYRLLKEMLPRYRALALVEGKTLPKLNAAPKKSVKPGETAPFLDIIRTRLMALGDLPPTTGPLDNPLVYEGDVVEGVKHFQLRHGIEGDGVLGKSTWAALAVPLSWRQHQIELAMERMRWLPHLGERPFIAVNIPMYHLWAWDHVPENGAPDFGMGVIVGKALDTRTPVFLEEMKYLTFQPYWNVPPSILTKEILPAIRKNPAYLDSHDMEIVNGQGDDAKVVELGPESMSLLAKGKLRVRQRAGAKNSLGPVVFIFPNDDNVYMHGTPAPELFGRARRDFSHGCIRLEDPVALAEWVLRDQPQWTREKIVEAMHGKPAQRVGLTRPVRVVLYYVTATVIPSEQAIHFADDIYDQDPALDKALHAALHSL